MYGQYMGHMWLRRLNRIWAIVFPHNVYNAHHMGNSGPIFGLGAGATYCPYTALMWAVWPISCQYIAHTVANIWVTKSLWTGFFKIKLKMARTLVLWGNFRFILFFLKIIFLKNYQLSEKIAINKKCLEFIKECIRIFSEFFFNFFKFMKNSRIKIFKMVSKNSAKILLYSLMNSKPFL